jgi:2-polyprenyl-3-methyl-5-hydroxy-6-metoxy-1,4-benzoquinol methylase
MRDFDELDPWTFVTCPVCGADNATPVTDDWQTLGDKQYTFHLVQYRECGLVYVNPRLDREKTIGTPGGGAWTKAAQVNRNIYQNGLERLRSLLDSSPAVARTDSNFRLIDVVCGYGAFLDVAQKSGFDVVGVEIDEKIAEGARSNGFIVYDDYLERLNLPSDTYDAITLWDVIEHVPDPVSLIAECHRLLKPGGILFYHTGNAAFQVTKGRILAKLRPNRGPNNVPIQHLLHLSEATSRYLLDSAGAFDYIEIRFLDTLNYPNKKKFAAMKTYNELMRLLHRLGMPLWTSSLAAFARKSGAAWTMKMFQASQLHFSTLHFVERAL